MNSQSQHKRSLWGSPTSLVLCAFLLVALLFLWLEHRAHLLGALPLVLPLLICIGLHVFLHGGHGDHRGGPGRDEHDAR